MGEQGLVGRAGSEAERLTQSEKQFWASFWRVGPVEILHESGADLVQFGSILAFCFSSYATQPGINFILGAGEEGSVAGGHLADAVRWLETRTSERSEERGVDFRVPVVPGLPESEAAGEWLRERGFSRDEGARKLVRDGADPQITLAADLEVLEWDQWDEGFSGPMVESLGISGGTVETLFLCLIGAEGWHCCGSIIGDEALAYAAMHIEAGVASIALASRPCEGRDGEGQMGVLGRCIEDGLARGCDRFVLVDAGDEPPVVDREAFLRAGFEIAHRVPNWRSPARPGPKPQP